MTRMPVTLGLERLIASKALVGRRIGLVCNPASVDRHLQHAVDRLTSKEAGLTVAALFGPQHGIHADVQDNMVETPHRENQRRRVPVYSLYSDTREPTPEMLAGLEALVVDLPDVGSRIYTFIYTMANCLRAGARVRRARLRLRSPQPHWRRRGRGSAPRARIRIVRGPVSDSDAARHDDRRAGAVVQRPV